MANGLERFTRRAREAGVEVDAHEFGQGTRTAADAAAAIGCDVAQIVKSLVFVADGQPVLALVSGADRVDTERIAAQLGAVEVRKASADEVREATGFGIGATPPLGHDTELDVLLDEDLLAHDEVWAAAGSAMHVFPISPQRLGEVARAQVARIAAG